MKYLKFCLVILIALFLSMTLGLSSSHAVLMTITEGTYTPYGGDPISITGTVDLVNGPGTFHIFNGVGTIIYLDGISPFTIYWEGSPSENFVDLWYGGTGYEDYPGMGGGRAYYTIDSYDHDMHRAEVSSWDGVEFDISFYDYPDLGPFSLSLTASANAVPEPATVLLLGTGLLGLVGFRKRFTK